jgi:hypothetical protein
LGILPFPFITVNYFAPLALSVLGNPGIIILDNDESQAFQNSKNSLVFSRPFLFRSVER